MTGELEKVRQILLQSRNKAGKEMDDLRSAEIITFSFLNEKITNFILAKFMLEKGECKGVDFQKLSELSLSKTMEISPELVKEFDTARSCAGATSATAKKTLLYLSVQKELQIELAAEKTPKVHTFEEFSGLVWDAMEKTAIWLPKLKGSKTEK